MMIADTVHLTVLWICAAAAVLIFAAMIYSVATFRRAKETAAVMPSRTKTAEILWTLIPIAILIGAAIPALLS